MKDLIERSMARVPVTTDATAFFQLVLIAHAVGG